jgi:hypothetical protein
LVADSHQQRTVWNTEGTSLVIPRLNAEAVILVARHRPVGTQQDIYTKDAEDVAEVGRTITFYDEGMGELGTLEYQQGVAFQDNGGTNCFASGLNGHGWISSNMLEGTTHETILGAPGAPIDEAKYFTSIGDGDLPTDNERWWWLDHHNVDNLQPGLSLLASYGGKLLIPQHDGRPEMNAIEGQYKFNDGYTLQNPRPELIRFIGWE